MSLKSNQDIKASDWLDVRDRVAAELKSTSSSQLSTRIAMSEQLLRAGFIDIDSVFEAIHPAAIVTDPTEAAE